jgi:hypothetical protein
MRETVGRIVRCVALAGALAAMTPPETMPRAGEPAEESPAKRAEKPSLEGTIERLLEDMGSALPEDARARLGRGLRQVAQFWQVEDGGPEDLEEFVRAHFAADPAVRDTLFHRFERILEAIDGHLGEIARELRTQADLDLGPILPADELFAGYDPSAHILDDFFDSKLAFSVLLNFPLTTLGERLTEGKRWTRRQWAEARLAERFSRRVPAEVSLAIARASSAAERYIAQYNIWAHHLLDPTGRRLFPPKMRLLSHWNLRDQIKADYSEPTGGLARQRLLQTVMERIVTQTIPAAVIDNPRVDWDPMANAVRRSPVDDGPGSSASGRADSVPDGAEAAGAGSEVSPAREPDRRYAVLLETFRAARLLDPYSPTAPTHRSRSFDEGREIPEERVRAMLLAVLSSPLVPRVAALVEERLDRALEPFDIWYNGFRPRGSRSEGELDLLVRRKYPDAEAFKRDIPEILRRLGFTEDRAAFIAGKIEVDPARGSGHAMGASMRSASARLRTRIGRDGMDYKGYNIALHELGHNVEQVISLHDVDSTLLEGVPNTAFTEAFAFVFQAHDLELLGLETPDPEAKALKVLNDFWATFEIAGVALVDMEVWRWMYGHPEASPEELRDATLELAKRVWNEHYAPVFRRSDVLLLGIYSHMIESFLYLPDYPVGHIIAHQVERVMEKAGSVGPTFERMARYGDVAPDIWMENAAGTPVGPEALLSSTEEALGRLGG